MKSLTRGLSIVLVICMAVLCFAGCHKKNEIAVKIGSIEIKSSTYSCLLIQAYQEGIEAITERDEEEGTTDADYTDGYLDQELDDKSFTDWVKDRAVELCKDYAAVYTLAAENNITLTDEELANVEYYADYYWNTYGMGAIYENMGVAFETYTAYFGYSQLRDKVFSTIYGEEGSLAVEKSKVLETLYKYHDTYKILEGPYTDADGNALSDSDIAAKQAKFQGYVDRLNAGENFKTIYCEVNGITSEEFDKSYAPATESDGTKALDPLETVIGAEGTYAENTSDTELFDTVNALEIGKATLLTHDDCCDIVYKTDITADPYYQTSLYNSALYYMMGDTYEEYIVETYEALEYSPSKYAMNQFKVKDIDENYITLQQAYSASQYNY